MTASYIILNVPNFAGGKTQDGEGLIRSLVSLVQAYEDLAVRLRDRSDFRPSGATLQFRVFKGRKHVGISGPIMHIILDDP